MHRFTQTATEIAHQARLARIQEQSNHNSRAQDN
jgi:hypothetical protein